MGERNVEAYPCDHERVVYGEYFPIVKNLLRDKRDELEKEPTSTVLSRVVAVLENLLDYIISVHSQPDALELTREWIRIYLLDTEAEFDKGDPASVEVWAVLVCSVLERRTME